MNTKKLKTHLELVVEILVWHPNYPLFKADKKGTRLDAFSYIRKWQNALATKVIYAHKGWLHTTHSVKAKAVVWDLVSTWFTFTG